MESILSPSITVPETTNCIKAQYTETRDKGERRIKHVGDLHRPKSKEALPTALDYRQQAS